MQQADSVYKRGGATGYEQLPPPNYPFPPVRQTVLYPSRAGASKVPTIFDVLGTNRLYPDARGRVSGYAEPGYSGTSRPATSWM